MENFPSTDNVQVAAIAAALEMAQMGVAKDSDEFDETLARFIKAYQAIFETVRQTPTARTFQG